MPHSSVAALTARQTEVLNFIRGHCERAGYPPSIREIGDAMSIGSPNGVMCHMRALVTKGYIIRGSRKARGITLAQSA